MKKLIRFNCTIILLLLALSINSFASEPNISVILDGEKLIFNENSGIPFILNNRTLVPLRLTLESINAKVSWDNINQQALVEKNDIKLIVPIGENYIYKNNIKIQNDSKAIVKNGRTYLPIRVVMESLDYNVSWDDINKSVIINSNLNKNLNKIKRLNYNFITDDSQSLPVNGLIIDLKNSSLSVKMALANNEVGATNTLENIVKDNNAIIGINGSYFSAYDKTDVKDPYGILVKNGKVIHNANDRAVIGFGKDGIDIDRVDTKIKGDSGDPDWKYSWNGYWINHSIIENGPSLTVFDNNRGEYTKTNLGTNYIVKENEIVNIIKNKSVKIPENGYVANLYGDLDSSVYSRFKIGNSFNYETELIPESGDLEFWNSINTAVGAGPALILDGKIDIDYNKEHFTESKITQNKSSRSAIGYTKENKLILVTTTATIKELAKIMKSLGCYEAMNLDGGASSGLYYNGKYIREPGRDISNIIYIK